VAGTISEFKNLKQSDTKGMYPHRVFVGKPHGERNHLENLAVDISI